MLPVILAAASIGLTAAGSLTSFSGARNQARAQQSMIQHERQGEEIRRQAMELDARRRMAETIRQAQRARAMALTVANAQGAASEGSSALMGAYGQIRGQTQVNQSGIQDNLSLGRQMFDVNALISQDRMNIARAGGTVALGQGISSLGSTLMGNFSSINNAFSNFTGTAVSPNSNPYNQTGSLY